MSRPSRLDVTSLKRRTPKPPYRTVDALRNLLTTTPRKQAFTPLKTNGVLPLLTSLRRSTGAPVKRKWPPLWPKAPILPLIMFSRFKGPRRPRVRRVETRPPVVPRHSLRALPSRPSKHLVVLTVRGPLVLAPPSTPVGLLIKLSSCELNPVPQSFLLKPPRQDLTASLHPKVL